MFCITIRLLAFAGWSGVAMTSRLCVQCNGAIPYKTIVAVIPTLLVQVFEPLQAVCK